MKRKICALLTALLLAGTASVAALGVVCDLTSLTDAQGNDIWRNYGCSGRPVATEMPFDFEIPMADVQGPVQVELYFGVNEDLGSRFEQDARLILSVPLLAD